MKIERLTEIMFSHAVALAQNGRMKSTIHCKGKDLFILNMDSTILLKYEAPQFFEEPFSFFANDYESPRMRVEGGQVAFTTNNNGIKRVKTCPAPKMDFGKVEKMFKSFEPDKSQTIIINKNMAVFLEDGLSHVEIENDKKVKLVQRDIYSGQRIEVSKNKSFESLLDLEEDLDSFPPIGIRTMDFKALFTFTDTLIWYIQKDKPWVYIEDNKGQMKVILATCLYDELPGVKNIGG